jgi:hypothetical protein
MNAKMTEDNAKLQKQVNDHNAKLQKQVDELSKKMTEDNAKLQKQLNDHNAKLQKQVDDLSGEMSRMCEMQTEVMMKVTQMMTEVKQLKQMIPDQQLVRKSIIIAGGHNGMGFINSVEIFSWENKTWTLLNPMLTCCAYASAVTYQGEVIISGGYDRIKEYRDTMETSSCGASVEWKISPVKLPHLCRGHATLMYKDSLILSGGDLDSGCISDKIYEISMVPPYSTNILATMPEQRYDHTMELFEDKLFIIGGYDGDKTCDTVMMYNLVTKEWKMMKPLPFPVDEMAGVIWHNNVILLGGREDDAYITKDTVVMYNLTTGESKYLPSMKHKRQGCAAVVTGDVLVVMGGFNDESGYVIKSAEAFHFQEQFWEELPDMNEERQYASAVVKPN